MSALDNAAAMHEPNESDFEHMKARHDRFSDETCTSCLPCYKRYGVGYLDPDCTECFGICSNVAHLQKLGALCIHENVTDNCGDCALERWEDQADTIAKESMNPEAR